MLNFWNPGTVGSFTSAFAFIVLDGNEYPSKLAVAIHVPSSHSGYTCGPGRALLNTGFDRSLRSRRCDNESAASANPGVPVSAAAPASIPATNERRVASVVSEVATTSPRLARTQTGREPRLGAARDADGRARTGAHVRDRDAVSMVTLEDERDAGVSGERRLSVA